MTSILNLGLSGLTAYQRALETTAHNISNVNTPGYSRQETVIGSRPAQFTGGGFAGSGVELKDIRRTYDRHVVEQLRVQTSVTKELEIRDDLAARLENLFNDDSAGLGPALKVFFDSVSAAAEDPTSLAARQVMLSDAKNATIRFRELQNRMDDLRGDMTTRMNAAVSEVNAIATSISDINKEMLAASDGASNAPNDLLDQRDELIRQLAELIDVTTVENSDRTINVMVGSGHALVMRTGVNDLAVARDANDPRDVDVVVGAANSISLGWTISGGTIGGLLNMQSGYLATAERELGHLGLAFADGFNQQHQLGMDLSGQLGGLLFTDINDPALQAARTINNGFNTGNAELGVTIDDVSALQDNDYRLDFDGTNFNLIRLPDESPVDSFAGFPHTLATEGFTIDLGGGAALPGDSFTIRPAAHISRGLQVEVEQPGAIALAAPVRAQSSLDNLGDAQISQERVANLAGAALANDINLVFDAAANQFTVSAPPGGTLAYDPATESGKEFTLSPAGFGDVLFTMRGSPLDGDTFTIESNQGGTGDNRNGLALSEVRMQKRLDGGQVSVEEAFGLMLANIGSRSRQLEINFSAQSNMLTQIQGERESISGVNLDEEAVNLMRYQQAYEASARVISVADELFDILLQAAG